MIDRDARCCERLCRVFRRLRAAAAMLVDDQEGALGDVDTWGRGTDRYLTAAAL